MGVTLQVDVGKAFNVLAKQLEAKSDELKKTQVSAGLIKDGNKELADMPLSSKQHADNSFEEVAAYAVYNEYGTSRIPARPFMRTAIARRGKAWTLYAAQIMQHTPLSAGAAFDAAGKLMASDIRASINQEFGTWIPNAPRTIEKKTKTRVGGDGSAPDKMAPPPLVDTGSMLHWISYKVDKSK